MIFTGRELDVLAILLKHGPLTASGIADLNVGISYSVANHVLRSLSSKKIITESRFIHTGTNVAQAYSVTELGSKELIHYFSDSFSPFIDTLGVSNLVKEILSSLDEDKRSKELEELRKLLE